MLGQFFDDCCVFEERAQVSVKDLRQAYERHCEEIGETPLSPSVFGQQLKERGFKQKRTSKARSWTGLRLAGLDDDFVE